MDSFKKWCLLNRRNNRKTLPGLESLHEFYTRDSLKYFEAPKRRRHSEPSVMKVPGLNPLDWTLEQYYAIPSCYGEILNKKGSTAAREWKRWLTRLTDQRIDMMYTGMLDDMNALRYKKRVHRTYANKRPYIAITETMVCNEKMPTENELTEKKYKLRLKQADVHEKSLIRENDNININ